MAAADPRYEFRPQQVAMSQAVAETLDGGGSLVVEAPTGVGKSLAYLLPGALWAATEGRRVLVSTYTRALQEQIVEHDLPLVASVLRGLGVSLRYAMLQGSDNYLCVGRLAKLAAQPDMFSDGQAKVLSELASWARTADTGHRGALPRLVAQGLWEKVSRDPDLCLGSGGRFWSQCLYRRDRERAEGAHILVVNHALLLSGARMPEYDALVIDEAHNLEDTAVSHFGALVSRTRAMRIVDEARVAAESFPEVGEAGGKALEAMGRFLSATARAHGWEGTEDEPGGRLLAVGDIKVPEELEAFEAALLGAATKASGTDGELILRTLHGRAVQLRSDLAAILDAGHGEAVARWVEWAGPSVELRLAPLDVAERLGTAVFGRGVPAVLTSATLSGGEGLRAFTQHVGLGGAREMVLDSPFDYPTQAGLLLAEDLAAPSEDGAYYKAVAGRCVEIAGQVKGGMFILFSSWKSLRRVHELLKGRLGERPLWMQGMAGHEALVADFAEAGNAVLLGVDTFWQGVDVPGQTLSCVVLVKLPFGNIASPVEEARRRWHESRGKDYFRDHSLPRAVMKFRQGFGRLIRSSSHRGAVVVLDSRVLKRGYGEAFLEALPRCKKLASVEELGSFLNAA